MCGIAGILNADRAVERSDLEKMAQQLARRGPDAQGILHDKNYGLVHRRLKIIDRSDNANQPMHAVEKKVQLVFNGEIYNFRELRLELQKLGARFTTESDTEVLLQAYLAWGIASFERFSGMFAFAILDLRDSPKAFLVRDRFGIKPLFYSSKHQDLVFASTLSPLLATNLHPWEISENSLASFVKFSHVPQPESMLKQVKQLRPGHFLTWTKNEVAENCFLNAKAIKTGEFITDEKTALRLVDEALERAVQRQMVADVPIGCFLSGGIDSSLLVAYFQKNSPTPIETFSIGYREQEFDERLYARTIADTFGTKHTEILVSEKDCLQLIPELHNFFDHPFADPTLLPTLLLAKETKKHVTVVLSGDGGDELFFGYLYEQILLHIRALERIPAVVRTKTMRLISQALWGLWQITGSHKLTGLIKLCETLSFQHDWEKYAYFIGTVGPVPMQRIEKIVHAPTTQIQESVEKVLARYKDVSEPERIAGIFMETFLIDTVLTKTDRATMAYGLESRVPFLDEELVALAKRIPFSMKLRGGTKKWLLREVLRSKLSPALSQKIVDRPKQGFSVPIRNWLLGDLAYLIEEYLAPQRIERSGLFNPNEVSQLVTELRHGYNHSHLLWSLLSFELWREEYL